MQRERRLPWTASVIALLLAAALAGCWRGSPPEGESGNAGNPADAKGGDAGNPADAHVTDVTVGRALGPDGMIADDSRTNSFWTTDKFYVAVTTDGAVPGATVKARWKSSDGSVVAEDSKTVDAGGKAVLLQAAPPNGRWNTGDYSVEILVNDVAAGRKQLVTR